MAGKMSMKNSNDTIGKETRDLPARIAVPQPTAPTRAAGMRQREKIKHLSLRYKDTQTHVRCINNATQRRGMRAARNKYLL